MNDMFERWLDVSSILPRLPDMRGTALDVWLGKCLAIDRRMTMLWVRGHADAFDSIQYGQIRQLMGSGVPDADR